MTYEPLSHQEKLLIQNLLRARITDARGDPTFSEEAYRLPVAALEKLVGAVDVLVVRR